MTVRRWFTAATLVLASIAAAAGVAASPAHAVSPWAPLRNVQDNTCIAATAYVDSPLQMQACNGSTWQNWSFFPSINGGSRMQIRNQESGRCWYLNGPVQSFTQVSQAVCTEVSNEDWVPDAGPPPPSKVTRIRSWAGFQNTNLCVIPHWGSVIVYLCTRDPNQKWIAY